jgi:plasmid stabilization system protein ParE
MAFRVEITEEAERDATSILDWLISQQAGETGLRWFEGSSVPNAKNAAQKSPTE